LAKSDLEAMGVEIRLNSQVTGVEADGILIGEERVPAENVIWAAGVQGTPIARSLGAEVDAQGRVLVGPDCSIPGHPEVFVIGDAAHAIDANSGQPVPGVAQGAIQMATFVAKIVGDEIEGNTTSERPSFTYHDKGSMSTIGRGKALASVNGRTFHGFLGWLAWGLVHLMFLVGFRTKVFVMFDRVRGIIPSAIFSKARRKQPWRSPLTRSAAWGERYHSNRKLLSVPAS
jgi:NADH dehydrogenase